MILPTDAATTTRRSSLGGTLDARIGLLVFLGPILVHCLGAARSPTASPLAAVLIRASCRRARRCATSSGFTRRARTVGGRASDADDSAGGEPVINTNGVSG